MNVRYFIPPLILLALLVPNLALATPSSWDFASGILQPLQSQWAALVKADHYQATSTTASIFPYASTTATSATSLCLGSDCRQAWPISGSPGGTSGQLQYNAAGSFGGVATSSASCSSGVSCTTFTVVGSVSPSITNTGVLSFNTRTGAVTLSSGDVTTALGFTPYNATNPSGYISNITGLVTQGTNVTITGSGTSGSPYVVNATGGGGSGTVSTSSSETANYIPKWTSTSGTPALLSGTSLIYDDGTHVGIGTAAPAYALDVVGKLRASLATTDATNKQFYFLDRNYLNAQNDFLLLQGQSKVNGNIILFGGGQTGNTAASTIAMYAGTGNNTDTGTLEVTVNTSGLTLSTLTNGVVKSTSGLLSNATNGTDYSLITANTCTTGQFFSAATAAGVFTCSTPSGGSSGLATSSPISDSNLLVYSAKGAGSAYGVATSSPTNGTGITLSGTGSVVGGSLSITNSSPLSGLTASFPFSFSNPTLSWLGLSTSSPGITSGQPVYATGPNTIASVASSTFLSSIGGQVTGNYITALTGDVTASGPGSSAATLATVNTNVGSFTNANITVNAKGLITAASNGTAGSSVAGSNGQIQYNKFGSFGADPFFTIATTTGITTLGVGQPNGSFDVGKLALSYAGSVSDNTITFTPAGGTSGAKVVTIPNLTGTMGVGTPSASSLTYWGSDNSLQSTATSTLTASSPLTGSFTQIGSGGSLGCQTASGSQAGCLSSTDWTTFNGKQPAGSYLTALTGDVTASGPGSAAATLATVNTNTGSWGSATQVGTFTVNGKGLITAAGNVTVTPAVGSITGLGTGVATALGVNVGTAGAFVVNGGALGTPSSGTLTNATGLLPAGMNLTKGNFLVGNDSGIAQATSTIFISSAGNIGIGTTSPYAALSVSGNLVLGGNITATSTATSTFASDLNLPTGHCYQINGTCLTAGSIGGGFTQAVNWATTAVLAGTPTYSNGASGVGATLTEVGTGALSVDGNSPVAGDRVLVKTQASAFQNGIYTVTATGSGIASYVLTRSSDYNTPTEITPGINTYVLSGTANMDTTWAVSFTPPLVIGTNSLTYTESAGGVGVSSVSNSDSTLTISPTTGAVVASLNLATTNNWTGFVGIGTSTPAFPLSISTSTQQSGTLPLFTVASTTNKALFAVLGNGNVAIGTSSPLGQLHIESSVNSNNAILYNTNTTSTNQTRLFFANAASGATTNVSIGNINSSGSFGIRTGGTGITGSGSISESITSTGDVGIGGTISNSVTMAGAKLAIISGLVGIASTTPTYLLSIGSGSSAASIDSSGNLQINSLGTAAGAFLAVDPNGKVIATTTPSSGGGSTVTRFYVTATSGNLYQNTISVVSGDTLNIWASTDKSGALLGGTSCSNDGNAVYDSIIIKQSTFAASSTLATGGAVTSSGNTPCAATLISSYTATTTETVNVQLNTDPAVITRPYDKAQLMIQKIH